MVERPFRPGRAFTRPEEPSPFRGRPCSRRRPTTDPEGRRYRAREGLRLQGGGVQAPRVRERRDEGLMDGRTGGDHGAVVKVEGLAGEAGDAAARFLDEEHAGGEVPGREADVPEAVVAAGRDVGELEGGGGAAPDAVGRLVEGEEGVVVVVRVGGPVGGEAGGEERVGERLRAGDRDGLAVAGRAVALGGGEGQGPSPGRAPRRPRAARGGRSRGRCRTRGGRGRSSWCRRSGRRTRRPRGPGCRPLPRRPRGGPGRRRRCARGRGARWRGRSR